MMGSSDVVKGGLDVDVTDDVEKITTTQANDASINRFTVAEQRKIIWKIDRRLVTILGVMYCTSLMDRTNLGAASIAGYVQQ